MVTGGHIRLIILSDSALELKVSAIYAAMVYSKCNVPLASVIRSQRVLYQILQASNTESSD